MHTGTNGLTVDKTPDEIFSEMLRLIKELKTDKNLLNYCSEERHL